MRRGVKRGGSDSLRPTGARQSRVRRCIIRLLPDLTSPGAMPRLLCALLLVLIAFPAAAQVTRIAAVVNDEVISVRDLAARLHLVIVSANIPDTPENEQKLSHQVLRNLIDEKLEMQEAKRLNVTVSESEINAALARLERQNKMPKGGLDRFLDSHGIDRSTL